MTGRARLLRAGQIALAVGVVALAVTSLARNWEELRTQAISWDIDWAWLAVSLVTVLATFMVLIEAWRRVVTGMGEELGLLDATRICMVANLGKYVPGKVWSIAGAAVLAQRAGVAAPVAVAAAVVLQALALASGVVLVAILSPGGLSTASPALAAVAIILGVASLGGVGILTSGAALARVQRWLPDAVPPLEPIPTSVAAAAFAVNVGAWLIYGAAIVFLANGLFTRVDWSWIEATAIFTAAYVVGLVAVFAPAGLGPREGVFVLLLTPPLGPKMALALALAIRALWTVAELGAALPFLIGVGKKSGSRV